MTEWGSILAVFWALYLADGLRGGRHDRLFFHQARGTGRRARLTQVSWFLAPPLPAAWTLIADDLPASLAPEGLTNWPSAAASRPPPLPEAAVAFRWEDVQKVESRQGWIVVNGRRFAPETPALTALALDTLAKELKSLPPEARGRRLAAWQARRLASARLGRRVRSALGRSRGLARLNTLQTALLAIVSGYLLADGPDRVSPPLRDALAAAFPAFIGLCAGLHLFAVGWFFRLHRRLHPRAGQDRASLVFTALLVPPQALRLRQQLCWRLAEGFHPVAVALAAARPETRDAVVRATLRDVRWPGRPAGLPDEVTRLIASSAAWFEPVLLGQLDSVRPAPDPVALLAAPVRQGADVCAYCPRCGDQFTRADGRCPQGVPLRRF